MILIASDSSCVVNNWMFHIKMSIFHFDIWAKIFIQLIIILKGIILKYALMLMSVMCTHSVMNSPSRNYSCFANCRCLHVLVFALPRLGNGPLQFLLQLLHMHLCTVVGLRGATVLQFTQCSLSLWLIHLMEQTVLWKLQHSFIDAWCVIIALYTLK
jgi:hypothetical protein